MPQNPTSPSRAAQPNWQLGPFTRPAAPQPIIVPVPQSTFLCPLRKTAVAWEKLHTFNPAAVVKDGTIVMLYRAEDDSGAMEIGGHTSRLGLATSTDGIHFVREATPVLFPDADAQQSREWQGGCEDPRLAERDDGTYVLTYTQWNHQATHLAVASSRDLRHWTKHGPAFAQAFNGKYLALGRKSAAIVHRIVAGRMIAAKIQGKYWMYWGEGTLFAATSDDLISWSPVEGSDGTLLPLLAPRRGLFDSNLVEAGPPPLLTERGIIVLYNGKNHQGPDGDPRLKGESYAGGQALFAAAQPTRLLDWAVEPFFKPELPWEAAGQYVAGTTFIEGLVLFKGSWFLYYGCADSFVGVATSPAGPAGADLK